MGRLGCLGFLGFRGLGFLGFLVGIATWVILGLEGDRQELPSWVILGFRGRGFGVSLALNALLSQRPLGQPRQDQTTYAEP